MFLKFKAKKIFGILAFPIILMFFVVPSQSNEVAQAKAIIEQLMHETGIPGLSVTVIVDGEEKWSEGFGLADLENGVKVSPDTVMRIGSISKSITATALAKAREQNNVDIDIDIHEYLPSFPEKKYPVTLRQLGGHLGGIRHYKDDHEENISQHFDTVFSSLNLFQDDPLISVPNSEYHYSSYGYNLLSAVIEAIYKTDFLRFLEKTLWQPLGMTHTEQDDVNKIIIGRAKQYEKNKDGILINAPYTDNSYKFAGAGMLSSSSDLAKFGTALVGDSFLAAPSKKLLFSSQNTDDGKPTGYGFGWFVDMNKFLDDRKDKIPPELLAHLKELYTDRQLIWHSGSSSGAISMLLLAPETKTVVAIIVNLGGVGPQTITASMEIEALFSAAFHH